MADSKFDGYSVCFWHFSVPDIVPRSGGGLLIVVVCSFWLRLNGVACGIIASALFSVSSLSVRLVFAGKAPSLQVV